jgi:acetylornithine deacetylase/succinyl-diaminopimelate desuccinylase-like protein
MRSTATPRYIAAIDFGPPQEHPLTLADTFDHIDAHRNAFLERLFAYLRMPSISAHGVGIAENGAFLVSLLTSMGLEARLIETAGWPLVYGRRDDVPGGPRVLLYGHYDVQPPDPLDQWYSPPFEPEIRDGSIYARGAGDNKGQHFANLMAIESLRATTASLPCNVIVLLEGEEEVGSPNIAEFVRNSRDLLDVDLVITSDGPIHDSGRNVIEFGVRGVADFELRARGANRDLHSGNFGGVAPNPIWTLVHALATMKNAAGEITIDGFHDAIVPPTDLERAAVANLPDGTAEIMADLGLTRLDAPRDRPYYDRLMAHPTLTINGFHGGYGGPGSKTVLPSEAFVKCDVRLVLNQTVAVTHELIRAHLARHAPEVEFVPGGGMDPSKTPLDSPWTEPIRAAIRTATGEEPYLVPAMGGSLPEYVWTKLLGVPAFVVPYANHDERNHAPNENIEVERFITGIKIGAALLFALVDDKPQVETRG